METKIKSITNWIIRHKGELVVLFVFLLFAFGYNIYRVQGDGKLYYALLERTLNIPDPESAPNFLELGFLQSICSFFNMPFYLAGYAIEKMLAAPILLKGITLRSAFINIASNFYIGASIILIFKILAMLNFKHRISSVLSILFSTSAFVAAVVMPAYNHAVDVLIVTFFIYVILKRERMLPIKSFWIGAVYSLAIASRYFNFVLIVPLLVMLMIKKDYSRIKYILFGFFSTIWILPVLFYYYNGSPFNPCFSQEAVGNVIHRMTLFPKYTFRYFVHPLHGLFVWSPVTILSAIGLGVMPRDKKEIGYMFLAMWALIVMMNGYFFEWTAGWSFSNRYLTGLFPIYIVGLAALAEKYGKRIVVLAAALTFYSVFLFFNWYMCVIDGGWGTPWNMIEAWQRGKFFYSTGKELNFRVFCEMMYEHSRYKYIFRGFN
ncbi:MAG: hypothetical protein ABIH85_02285 [Candidatus Omnitrophota bacterium]|nr:hypothetical protein [Candidatus Omnitrophota bacterium]